MLDKRFREWLSRPSCTVSQFAEMTGLSRNAAYEACERGEVPCVRIGKRIMIPTAPVRRMFRIDESEAQQPTEAAA